MNYDCLQCHSSQTASFEMMHAQGTQSGNLSASTITFGGDVGMTAGQFNSQTVLAGRLSPPVAPAMGCGIQLLIGIGAAISGIITGVVILGAFDAIIGISSNSNLPLVFFIVLIGGFFVCGVHLYNRFVQQKKMSVHREQLEEWSKSMICRRCGFMWIR